MDVKIEQLAKGEQFEVCEAIVDGKSLFKDFFRKLPSTAKRRLMARIKRLADNGPPREESKFTHESEGIYAIKDITSATRVYCFFHEGQLIIITHGFTKKYQRSTIKGKNNLEKALKIKNAFLNKE